MADGTSDDEQSASAYHIRAVERVCALLDLLQSSPGGVSLADAANATGLAKSSTFRYLVTLVDRDYAHHAAESGLYRAGRALFAHHASQVETLTLNARPLLAALAGELQETVMLGYLDATRLLYLDIRDSPRLVRSGPRQGDRDVIHATALGKAVASHLKDESVRAVLDAEGLPAFTPRTITGREAFLAELEAVRRRGYAIEDGEHAPDARGVAVVLPGVSLPVAVGVSAPSSRLPLAAVPDVAERLTDLAHRIVGEPSISRP